MLTSEGVRAAFPEYQFVDEDPREGSYKLTFRAQRGSDDVALKVIKAPVPDDAADEEPIAALGESFRREILAMTRVNSPFVVRILAGPELRQIGARRYLWYLEPYFPMILRARLGSRWSEAETVALVDGLLRGVEAMWSADKMVHRDIKPENIAVAANDAPVLLDLGVVLFTTMTTLTVGLRERTPMYAAPEQHLPRRDLGVDYRADFFAIGVTAYEMVVGALPFGNYRADPNQYVRRLVAGDADLQSLEASGASQDFVKFVATLLLPRAHQRFRMAQVHEALGACR